MLQPISLYIGLRYSRSRNNAGFVSFITFFSVAGIFLGVASLILVVSVMNGFEGQLKDRILGLIPHVVINTEAVDKNDSWQTKREELLKEPHVKQITPFIESEALISSTSSLKGVMLQGIMPDFEQDNIINQNMVEGKLSSLNADEYNLIIGSTLARKLSVNVGDLVRLIIPNKTIFTPMGRIPVQRTFRVSAMFSVGSQVDDTMIYVHSNNAAKLLRRDGDGVNQLRVFLDDAFYAKEFVEHLSAAHSDLNFKTWSESHGAFFSAVKLEKNMMWLMLSLIIAVATFNIISALVMVVIDKQGEIGILQTLGMSRVDVMKIFITQGMLNGLWGVLMGSILGVLLAFNLNDLMALIGVNLLGGAYQQLLPVDLRFSDVIMIIFSALSMSFIATLYPAYQASTTLPAEVLRNE